MHLVAERRRSRLGRRWSTLASRGRSSLMRTTGASALARHRRAPDGRGSARLASAARSIGGARVEHQPQRVGAAEDRGRRRRREREGQAQVVALHLRPRPSASTCGAGSRLARRGCGCGAGGAGERRRRASAPLRGVGGSAAARRGSGARLAVAAGAGSATGGASAGIGAPAALALRGGWRGGAAGGRRCGRRPAAPAAGFLGRGALRRHGLRRRYVGRRGRRARQAAASAASSSARPLVLPAPSLARRADVDDVAVVLAEGAHVDLADEA